MFEIVDGQELDDERAAGGRRSHWYIFSSRMSLLSVDVSTKEGKIRNRYNQASHLTQDTNGKVTTSKIDITNERQEASPFRAVDHTASTYRRA